MLISTVVYGGISDDTVYLFDMANLVLFQWCCFKKSLKSAKGIYIIIDQN